MEGVVAFTGAGISKASGIPTYEERPELRDLFSLEYFMEEPEEFWRKYRGLLETWGRARPNPAHLILAEMDIPVITQNIDRLHSRAGSRTVIELHGRYDQSVCTGCGRVVPVSAKSSSRCDYCGSYLKPDIVFYGEAVKHWDEAERLMAEANKLVVVGTSLEVYPAALLPELASRRGAEVMVVNSEAERQLPNILKTIAAGR
jgi:NAD-dependent deacetylase